MRKSIGVALTLAAAACTQKPGANETQTKTAPATVQSNSAAATEASSGSANAAASENHVGVLPPANASVRYVGTWATSPANCKAKPWRFTSDSLQAKGGPQCSFYNVAKVPGGYDVAAQCPTKTPIHTDLIKLRFAESAGAMLVESNAIAPTGLIYCGK